MDKVALFYGDIMVYWHGIFMGAAILLAVITALIFYGAVCKKIISDMLGIIAVGLPAGIIGARVIYCLCNFSEFNGIKDMFKMHDGGYALYGAIFAVILSAVIVRIFNPNIKIGECLNCLAVGGALGISVGRMASYFSYDNVGIAVKNEKFFSLPFSVYDPVSEQWYLATFTAEAVAEAVIFLILCIAFLMNNNCKKRLKGCNGDIALLFLMMHGASVAVFDSMHTDALRFSFNSFIRVQQVIGAVCLAVVMIIFLVRSISRAGKFKFYHFIMPLMILGMIGVALYMELDRISDTNYFRNHIIMMIALIFAVLMSLNLYKSSLKNSDKN